MNFSKQILFFVAAIVFFLNSCTIEKRIYMSGYNIEWFNNKHKPDNKLASVNNDKQKKQNQTDTIAESSDLSSNNNNTTATDENIVASADNKIIIIPQKRTNNLQSNHTLKISKEKNQIISPSKLKKDKKTNSSEMNESNFSGMAVAGFICSLGGFVSLFLFPLLFLLGTILGIIFSSIGLNETGIDKKRGKGLAIAGLVIGIINVLLIIIGILFLLFLLDFMKLII